MAAMLEFRTQGYNPYAVKYSPYYDSRIAVATSANFGIVGNGRVFALGLTAQGVQVEKTFDTNDALYDLAWSEINENQLIVACGDGSLKLFDLGVNDFPVMNFHEHKRETFSVCWSPITKDSFLSSSWDGTVKIWSPTRTQSLRTLPIGNCTYSASFCPSNPALISAVSSDSHLRIFDLRTPSSAKYHLVSTIPVHAAGSGPQPGVGLPGPAASPPAEVLTHDWNKYNSTVVATGGVDRIIRTFDIRSPAAGPLAIMQGHEYAVRRLAWSPHASDVLISASYDMTVRLWNDGGASAAAAQQQRQQPPQGPASAIPGAAGTRAGHQMGIMNRHTEFVTGVDWCLFGVGGWVASVGWDERVLLWDANMLMGQR
ncbi:peroxisomal targeting signal 2 receptor [Purpureocillium lilacinum]|nr:peroxisomal targeting signal 2 receptor [Purpureocillium lilacinum]OAQ86901.1 peroxisomal targeting signal 2 receptor [Purpureocillium lilacinum]OAQ94866.1 peroxisomal targeting signal 2 receptor [Purpureocillium lilacinum]GJN66869.1 peroxisomal targeting signal 2 receptor [Purpureocillium lilacinum]GJN80809.1 peroxisomal targeting signal 2 receptor [Purpureocillium lilacinum]